MYYAAISDTADTCAFKDKIPDGGFYLGGKINET
jgi:hypothetical protein